MQRAVIQAVLAALSAGVASGSRGPFEYTLNTRPDHHVGLFVPAVVAHGRGIHPGAYRKANQRKLRKRDRHVRSNGGRVRK